MSVKNHSVNSREITVYTASGDVQKRQQQLHPIDAARLFIAGEFVANVGSIIECRKALEAAERTAWGYVEGYTEHRPVWFLQQLFGCHPRTVAGRNQEGKEVKTGDWQRPFTDLGYAVRVTQFRLPQVHRIPVEPGTLSYKGKEVKSWPLQDAEKALYCHIMEKISKSNQVNTGYVNSKAVYLLSYQREQEQQKGWASGLKELSMCLHDGLKLQKRTKLFGSGFPIRGHLKRSEWTVKVFDGDSCELGEQCETTCDAAVVMSKQLFLSLEGASKWWNLGVKSYTFRGFIDGEFWKGQVQVVERPLGADLITHRVNVKKELSSKDLQRMDLFLIPNGGKNEVHLDVQTLVNFEEIFQKHQLLAAVKSEVIERLYKIQTDQPQEAYKRLAEEEAAECQQLLEESPDEKLDSIYQLYKRRSFHFLSKCSFKNSPSLSRYTFKAYTDSILPVCWKTPEGPVGKSDRLHIKWPCALHWQVVPASVTKMMGAPVAVEDGEVRLLYSRKLAVVSDAQWCKLVLIHGGCDGDDFFNLFFLEDRLTGERRVLITRSPNMAGEYSLLKLHSKSHAPKSWFWKRDAAGTISKYLIEWPKVDLTQLPKHISEMPHELTGFRKVAERKENAGDYTAVSLINAIIRQIDSVSPGLYVNALMLYRQVTGELPKQMIGKLEQVIDACQQNTFGSGVGKQVTDASLAIIREACRLSHELGRPVDRTLWKRFRGVERKLEQKPLLTTGTITQVIEEGNAFRSQVQQELEQWINETVQIPEAVIRLWSKETPAMKAALEELLHGYRREYAVLMAQKAAIEKEISSDREDLDVEGWKLMLLENEKELKQLSADLFREIGQERVGSFIYLLLTERTKTTQRLSDGIAFENQDFWASYMEVLDIPQDLMREVSVDDCSTINF